jgi:ABC-type Na+ transport system ATPase subunit NatA
MTSKGLQVLLIQKLKNSVPKCHKNNNFNRFKTRLFATNSMNCLPQTDHIIMLENGTIVESGHYANLLEENGQFFQFINIYLETTNCKFLFEIYAVNTNLFIIFNLFYSMLS